MKNCFRNLVIAAAAWVIAGAAQAYPERPVTLVVGWAVGGSTDVFARMIGNKLSQQLGQAVLVVNRPGASGTIGAQSVANDKPDGYTVYYGTNSTYALAPWLYKSLTYDFNKAFEPVAFVGAMPMIVGVHPELPVKTVRELVDVARKSPGKMTFGSSSPGSTSHIAAELFMAQTDTQLLHVPYKGGGPALTALLGGEIDILFNDVATFEPLIAAGKVRGLAVTSLARLPQLPQLPTVAESGVPGFEVSTTNAVFVPKGVPAAVVERLRSAIDTVLAEPPMVQEMLRRGMVVQRMTAGELAEHIAREQQKWRGLLQNRGIALAP